MAKRKRDPSKATTTDEGKTRCQWRNKRTQEQCPANARAGYTLCSKHGAGSAKTDKELPNALAKAGRATTVVDVRGTGRRELYERYPALQALYDQHAMSRYDELTNFRELLIETRALIDWHATLPHESDADFFSARLTTIQRGLNNIAAALNAQRQLADVDSEVRLRLAQMLNPIITGMEQIIVQFIPPEHRHDALSMLRDAVAAPVAIDTAIAQATRPALDVSNGHPKPR